MKAHTATALTLLFGVSLGAVATEAIHAAATPPVYAITEVSVTNLDAYMKEYVPLAQAAIKAAGGRLIAASLHNVSLDGVPPAARVAINQFDSLQQVQAWRNSSQFKDARKIGDKYATFRSYAVEGVPQ
jgi:uncharacterized protein (DUF1330 family)